MANIFSQLLPGLFGAGTEQFPGHHTQYGNSNRSSGKIQLVVGFDFGTAFAKVVVAERRRAYAVPFEGLEADGGSTYLLPANLSVDDEGRVHLGHVPGARHYSDLKMRILDGDNSDDSVALVTAFIALALQRVRAWFMGTHRKTYKNYEIDWYINVGLPTEHYHDDRLTSDYRWITNAAWLASTREEALDIDAVLECLADDAGSIGEHAIGLFPEFVAQVTGYVRSSRRKPDLHLLMDVGAGTVDVAIFNVHKRDGEDVFPIFAKSVETRGVLFLHRHRITSTAKNTHPFEEGLRDEDLARSLGIDMAKLRSIDRSFRNAVFEQVQRDVAEAKRKYPLSRHWDDGVPFFLCGGGANVELYSSLAEGMIRDGNPCRLVRAYLQKPGRLDVDGFTDGDYDRLSVAYGLSFDPFDLGEIERSDEIEDMDGGLGGPMACSKCRGTGGGYANSCSTCGGTGWIG